MIKKRLSIDKIIGIEAIIQCEQIYVIPSKNKKLLILSRGNLKIIDEINTDLYINISKLLSKNIVLFRDDNTLKSYLYDAESNQIEILSTIAKEGVKTPHSLDISGNLGIYYFQNHYLDKPIYSIFNYSTNEFVWSIKSHQLRYFGSNVFSDNRKSLTLYDELSGEVIWEVNFTDYLKPNGIVNILHKGSFKKTIALTIDDRNLIGVKIETGEIKWHVTNFNTQRYQLDENDGKLKGLVSNSYFEIDVITGDKKRFNLISHEEYIKNEMKSYDGPAIDSYRDNFVIVGDHIITTDSKSGLFGAFNTKTLKFDWWHEEPNVYFPAAKPIRYFDSLLFLLDHRDTLHIYKIEDFSL